MPRAFHGARIKLQRAKHHIDEIERQWNSFRRSGRGGVVLRDNPITRERGIFVEGDKSLQESIGILIGDVAHNLHSVLDHIIWDLVSPHNPPAPERVQFPFSKGANGLVGAIANRQVELAGAEVVKAINEIEPYPGGKGNNLVLLHDLNILDKHRVVSATIAALAINHLSLQRLDPNAPNIIFEGLTMIGGPLVRWPMPEFTNRKDRRTKGIAKDGQNVDATLEILFENSQSFGNKPVISTLVNLALEIDEVIKRFEKIP